MTVLQLADKVTTEGEAYAYLESLRWPTGDATCPHCGNVGADYIRPTNGHSRRTRTGALSERRVWRCGNCRRQFSVLTGTMMHGTKISVRAWVFVIFEMCASKNGISAREVERKYGMCPRSAWFMMHRIREAMKADPLSVAMQGVVVADETFIGGAAKNQHKNHPRDQPVPVVPGTPRNVGPFSGKIAVLSLISAETGEARSRVIADVTGATLRKAIAEQVNMGMTTLYTDDSKAYGTFASELAGHETVNHSADEYVRYENGKIITSNKAENYFSQLKRSLDGTHHRVSREHLHRYLAEFDMRFTTRKMTDQGRVNVLVGRMGGRRLTYKRITTV